MAATIPIPAPGEPLPAARGCYARAVPAHRQRSSTFEARVAGLAITLSVAALILVVVSVVGGYTGRVLIQIVPVYASSVAPSAPTP